MTFVRSNCLFLALVVKFSPSLRSGENFTIRAKNKQYALKKSCYSLIVMQRPFLWLLSILFCEEQT